MEYNSKQYHRYNHTDRCMYCDTLYVLGDKSFCNGYPKPVKEICVCGAETLYGKDTTLHSSIMPCPLYRKPE